MTDILSHLTFLYRAERSPPLLERVRSIINEYRGRIPRGYAPLSEKDAILISYGDQVQSSDGKHLRTLGTFCRQHLTGLVSGIHILPFYPWTSDDGFSVVDHRKVDDSLGSWEDVSGLRENFRLMFDGVINHISSQSSWFKEFLQNNDKYRDYFISVEGTPDLSRVVRPRTLPLLTLFSTPSGEKRVWTTFSSDQIDLNYQNPEVLLEILDILLMYAERGASFIRLDAIAYLWKEPGTSCIHLPQTHRIVQFLRAALDEAAAHVYLVTETNVPHADNVSYFGDGHNEAQLIYNFALPPMILHTFYTGDAAALSDWVKTLDLPSEQTTFLNFLASHDGIGLNPVRGILSEADIMELVKMTLEHGGLISCKHNPDGSESPYELNINYFDALSNPRGDEPMDMQIDRFMAAQAIMLSLVGVPAIYFHSLFGSRSWPEGVEQTKRNRTINRRKCSLDTLQGELADPRSLCARVFARYRQLLSLRSSSPAFHPHGTQNVLDLHPAIFALERLSPNGNSRALCLHNVSAKHLTLPMPLDSASDLLTDQPLPAQDISLGPYQILWMKR